MVIKMVNHNPPNHIAAMRMGNPNIAVNNLCLSIVLLQAPLGKKVGGDFMRYALLAFEERIEV
jgi:hypothetical protein